MHNRSNKKQINHDFLQARKRLDKGAMYLANEMKKNAQHQCCLALVALQGVPFDRHDAQYRSLIDESLTMLNELCAGYRHTRGESLFLDIIDAIALIPPYLRSDLYYLLAWRAYNRLTQCASDVPFYSGADASQAIMYFRHAQDALFECEHALKKMPINKVRELISECQRCIKSGSDQNKFGIAAQLLHQLTLYRLIPKTKRHRIDKESLMDTYSGLGNCMQSEGEWEHALTYYQQAISESDDMKPVDTILAARASIFQLMGFCNTKLNRPTTANMAYENAIASIVQIRPENRINTDLIKLKYCQQMAKKSYATNHTMLSTIRMYGLFKKTSRSQVMPYESVRPSVQPG